MRNRGKFYDDEEKRERDLILIDYDDPANNVYQVTEEWAFHTGHYGTREDVVFLINGIPVLGRAPRAPWRCQVADTTVDARAVRPTSPPPPPAPSRPPAPRHRRRLASRSPPPPPPPPPPPLDPARPQGDATFYAPFFGLPRPRHSIRWPIRRSISSTKRGLPVN